MNGIHHIRVDGKPYCHAEDHGVFHTPYPTNCAHTCSEHAEEGVKACKEQRPDLTYEVVEGRCADDPFWQTEEGRAVIELQDELQRMRWEG